MGEVIRYQAVVRLTLCVIDIAYCVYLFHHRIFIILLFTIKCNQNPGRVLKIK